MTPRYLKLNFSSKKSMTLDSGALIRASGCQGVMDIILSRQFGVLPALSSGKGGGQIIYK